MLRAPPQATKTPHLRLSLTCIRPWAEYPQSLRYLRNRIASLNELKNGLVLRFCCTALTSHWPSSYARFISQRCPPKLGKATTLLPVVLLYDYSEVILVCAQIIIGCDIQLLHNNCNRVARNF